MSVSSDCHAGFVALSHERTTYDVTVLSYLKVTLSTFEMFVSFILQPNFIDS